MRNTVRSGLLLVLASVAALGQQYTISTIAGGAPPPTPSVAITAAIGSPQGIAVDASGNVYFTAHNVVLEVDTNGMLTLVAGNARGGYSGDGGPATGAKLNGPSGLAMDSDGNLYIADRNNNVIREVTAEGVITTVAGNGSQGHSGDGGPATSAALNQPNAVAVDSSGALYISDLGNGLLRTVSPAGVISTIPATISTSFGPSTQLRPLSLAANPGGGVYMIDVEYCMYPAYCCPVLETVSPSGAVANPGFLYGRGYTFGVIGGAPSSCYDFSAVGAVAVDESGNVYVANVTKNENEFSFGTAEFPAGTILPQGETIAGGIAVDAAGNLYVAQTSANRIDKIDATGVLSTIAGSGIAEYSGDGGPATLAQLSDARSVALDASGNLYIADAGNNTVRMVGANGVIVTVVGNGTPGPSGDGGPAGCATLNQPQAVAIDPSGQLFIADSASIRKVSSNGIITSVVTPIPKFSPLGLAFDPVGNLYASNRSDNRVDAPVPSPSGTIAIIAGTAQFACSIFAFGAYADCLPNTIVPIGDGGQATNARLFPAGLASDASGNLYIADTEKHLEYTLYAKDDRIRKVSPTGIITTVAGNGDQVESIQTFGGGYSGDGGPATNAELNNPRGVAIDSAGNLYIADYGNYRVRKVTPDGTINTIAGNGTQGHSGDGGPATNAQLNAPRGIAVDASGNVYVADSDSVRLLQPVE